MKTTDTALLGHVSGKALSAAALSDLWTMCTQVLINGRILGVLVGGAVGAGNPKLAGIYLQVSLAVLCPLAVFVFVAWSFTDRVWILFGSDPEVSHMAGYYATVLAFAIPGILGFGQLSQFFSAQRIMRPEVNCSSLGLVMNLVLGLILVLGVGIPHFSGFGFKACPLVTMLVTYVQLAALLVVYVGIQKLHAPCWGGWDLKEITWPRIKTFSELYFPSALSSASDFWRVGVIGAMAAKLGEGEVRIILKGLVPLCPSELLSVYLYQSRPLQAHDFIILLGCRVQHELQVSSALSF
jgi:MATE family multidrug resistance protein